MSRMMRVTTKADFIAVIKEFESPELVESSNTNYDLINAYWYIRDKLNPRNSYELPGCRLSHLKYMTGRKEHIDDYYARERKLRLKYENWMHHVFGEHYTYIGND